MAKAIIVSESGLKQKGNGKLSKIITTATSSGTLVVKDGTEEAVVAVGTLTSTGACVPASHATSKLTSSGAMVEATHAVTVFTKTDNFLDGTKASGYITCDETIPTADDTVVLGARTYTFAALGGTAVNSATAVTVPLGNNAAETMKNLYQAFITDPLFDVVHTSAYVITVTYKTIGTAGNVTATEDSSHLAWDDGSTLTGGTDAETITIGSKVYTWKSVLDTAASATAIQVLIGSTLTISLANMKKAINSTGTPGLEYSFGAVIDPVAVCTASNATTFTIRGRVPGTSLNAKATTETCADGAFADTTLGGGTGASNPGVATTAATVTIGTTVYTVVDALSETYGAVAVAYQVLKGEDEAAMLDNLKAAINGTGTAGTEYSTGTVAHEDVIATTNTDTTQVIVSRSIGVTAVTAAINAIATTETMDNTAWADITLGGGTGDSNPAVETNAATITIGTRTYTATKELSETSGADAVVDQILWVTSEAVFLDNLKKTINLSGTEGTDYSTGTTINKDVIATTNANDSQVVQARVIGASGNLIATTDTLANYAWGATTLASGAGENAEIILNTYTPAAGSSIDIDAEFTRGLYVTVGGTSIVSTFIIE